jgi:hypothetical protein
MLHFLIPLALTCQQGLHGTPGDLFRVSQVHVQNLVEYGGLGGSWCYGRLDGTGLSALDQGRPLVYNEVP